MDDPELAEVAASAERSALATETPVRRGVPRLALETVVTSGSLDVPLVLAGAMIWRSSSVWSWPGGS